MLPKHACEVLKLRLVNQCVCFHITTLTSIFLQFLIRRFNTIIHDVGNTDPSKISLPLYSYLELTSDAQSRSDAPSAEPPSAPEPELELTVVAQQRWVIIN